MDGDLEEYRAGTPDSMTSQPGPCHNSSIWCKNPSNYTGMQVCRGQLRTMKQWVSPTSTSKGQVHTPSTSKSGKCVTLRPSHFQICKQPSLQRRVAYTRNADKESHKVSQITLKTSRMLWRASLCQRPKNEKMQQPQECRTRNSKRRSTRCKCRWQELSHPTSQRLMW